MENIFDKITQRIPKPKESDVKRLHELEQSEIKPAAAPDYENMPLDGLVVQWQKKSTPEITSVVLKKLRPTIDSALHSYAQGMEDDMRISATKLALAALKSYDATYGASPTTHVFTALKRLNRLASTRSNIIKYPEQLSMDRFKVAKATEAFEDEHNREPSMAELADLTGISQKRIKQLESMNTVVSASSTINPETQADTLGTKATADDDYYEYVYNSVSPIDQKIMEWTSGKGGKTYSNMEIARKLHVTPAAISQRKAAIQKKLSMVRSLV